MNLPKNVNNKIWAPKLIFFINKKKYIRMISDKENWLWTATNTDLSSLSTLTKKVQKSFQCNIFDQWTIQFNSINLALLWKTFIKFHWPCEKLTKACINENDVVIPIALIYHAAFEEDNPKVNVLVMENLKDQGYKPLRPETCGLVYMRAAMTRSDKT